jgi:benzylsuccinate CoA-transferase BbsF subunit
MRALDDVKVLDFTWVVAAPGASRVLADYGATVVRVETTKRVDTARTFGPFHGNTPGPESSILFQSMNAGKLGVTIDMSTEEGRAVALDLVRWADVVMESFSPRVKRNWSFDYESVRAVKSDIIMLSSCLMGQTGPLSNFAGYGSLAAALSGFYNVTGWPDRAPAGPYNAYTDTIVPRFVAILILAALDHKRRTGQGQYIDQSHMETALHFLGPALLDYTANGRVDVRIGDRDPQMAPHGVYPAGGDDRWVAIACRDDDDWRALCEVMTVGPNPLAPFPTGKGEQTAEARFDTLAGRLGQAGELDALISAWTRERDALEIETLLQSYGVPCSVVETSPDLFADPQLKHREHFVEVEHPTHGGILVEGSRFKLSRTPAKYSRSGPTMGRDNQYVLSELLSYSDDRIAELVAAGALE